MLCIQGEVGRLVLVAALAVGQTLMTSLNNLHPSCRTDIELKSNYAFFSELDFNTPKNA
jgi:hypothetical protein